MEKLDIFVNRLKRIGIQIEFWGNFPWVYLKSINGKPVKEKFQSEYGFVVGYSPIREDQYFRFTDLKEIFKIIRKYVNEV